MGTKPKADWEIERDKRNATIDRYIETLGLSYNATFVPHSQSRNKDIKDPCLNWQVQISKGTHSSQNLTTDYMQGIAHHPLYQQKYTYNTRLRYSAYEMHQLVLKGCESGKYLVSPYSSKEMPKPLLRDVLYCLVSDSDVLDHPSFEDWASDFGYDTDSIKANKIYQECVQNALKLRSILGDIGMNELKELFQDY